MTYRLMLSAAAVATLAIAAPAFAQSSGFQAQDNTPWHGWYAGVDLGGDWSHGSQHLSAAPGNGAIVIPPGDISNITNTHTTGAPAGFTGGIEGGYNYKYKSSGLLLGFETDFSWFNLDHHVTNTFASSLAVNPPLNPPPTVTISQSLKSDWLWTLRPRIGWVFGDGRWMVYGTGGLALSDVKQTLNYADTLNPPHTASFSKSETEAGWVAGLGGGYAISNNWSIKAEWLYTDLGTISATALTPNGYAVINSSGKSRANIVRVGVDYRF
jgi:outer membrane immunogenic protein